MGPCRSYPLHILTGHNLTIQPTVLRALLQADPTVPRRADFRHDNPLSLLYKNVLRFRWARDWEAHGLVPSLAVENCGGATSWMTVIAPRQFRD